MSRPRPEDPALAAIRARYRDLAAMRPAPQCVTEQTPAYRALVREIRALVDARTAAGVR